ncbi:MAG: glycosyltransferase family 39 protein [Bryobacteraceae bacterium]|jgi:hypothetical protein
MQSGHRAPWRYSLPAGLLVAVFVLQSLLASRIKSPVFDEPTGIAAGLSYVQTGEVRANLQHPPLLKELAGLALLLAGVRLPDTPQVERMLAGEGGETGAGNALISQNGPDRVLFWARLPLILLSGLLGALIWLWGRRIVGPAAALAAVFLWALDPTLLAHSFLVTMDVGLAVFTLLFVFALWSYVVRPGAKRLVWCGLALGAVLAAKFSAVFLLPVAAALLFLAVRWPPQPVPESSSTFLALYRQPEPAPAKPPAARGYAAAALAFVILCLLAMLVIQALYFSPGGLYLYSTGLQRVNADHDPAYLVFLAGRMQHQFLSYFAVAYLLKEPIPILALAGIGLAVLLRSKTVSPLAKLFLLLPPAVLFAAHSLWADNLGVRYIIPVLPFAYLIAGVGAGWLIQRRSRWTRPLAAVLGLWLVVAAIGIYPDHLAYFNEAACLPGNPGQIGLDGGTRCGPMWLDDSNVDWGQGLKQVKKWIDRNAKGRKVRLAYFGAFPPEAYGLATESIGIPQLVRSPAPGLYIVSAHLVAHAPALAGVEHSAAGDWLRDTPPVAVIGHSFYVYDRPGP